MTTTKLEPGKRYDITTTSNRYLSAFYIGVDADGDPVYRFKDGRYDAIPNWATTNVTQVKEPRTLTWWVAVLEYADGEISNAPETYATKSGLANRYPDAIDYMEITWTEKGEEDEVS